MSVLVTGGAGYIGAHVVSLLRKDGRRVVVVDNLSTGKARRVGDAELVSLDLSDDGAEAILAQIMRDRDVQAVIHLAGLKQVGESVARPLRYYRQNVGGMVNLLEAMEKAAVRRLVFSSSAAAYGMPSVSRVTETVDGRPVNPYGETKLAGEWLANACAPAWGLRTVNLRYFNVAGAESVELADPAALNLIPIVIERVLASQQPVIFGNDYPTRDGTCVRDYVHIRDLAAAHVAALEATGGVSALEPVLNLGTGCGASVLEVIDMVRKVSGREIIPRVAPRRPGDPAELVADAGLAKRFLDWRPELGLAEIVESEWEARLERHSSSR